MKQMLKIAGYSFAICTALLVGVPVVLCNFHISTNLTDTFLYMIYFRIPYLLFGNSCFYSDIATSPSGTSGWIITIVFYTALSLAVSLLVASFLKTKTNSEASNPQYDDLEKLIREIFPDGLTYSEGTQLCILLFSISFPNIKELALSKEELATLFSRIVIKKMISTEKREYKEIAKKLGADKFKVNAYEHWLAICLSILRFGQEAVDVSVRDQLIHKLKNFNSFKPSQ